MKKQSLIPGICASIVCIGSMVSVFGFQKSVSLQIGPQWTSEFKNTENFTGWNATAESGIIVDRMAGLGVAVHFLWNTTDSLDTIGTDNIYRPVYSEKFFMFPLCGYVFLDPQPDLIVHPVLKAYFGLNTLYYHKDTLDNSDNSPTKKDKANSGFYFGFFTKFHLDAVYDLGRNARIFSGLSWQLSQPRKSVELKGSDDFYDKKMNGFGLHVGMQFLL